MARTVLAFVLLLAAAVAASAAVVLPCAPDGLTSTLTASVRADRSAVVVNGTLTNEGASAKTCSLSGLEIVAKLSLPSLPASAFSLLCDGLFVNNASASCSNNTALRLTSEGDEGEVRAG